MQLIRAKSKIIASYYSRSFSKLKQKCTMQPRLSNQLLTNLYLGCHIICSLTKITQRVLLFKLEAKNYVNVYVQHTHTVILLRTTNWQASPWKQTQEEGLDKTFASDKAHMQKATKCTLAPETLLGFYAK